MDVISILDKKENLSWEYDEEDVLVYLLVKLKKGLEIDIGEGA
jgi:hypothetical protein